jgi:tetratricopeptide (TPR) repeat protein
VSLLTARFDFLRTACALACVALTASCVAQTYQVNPADGSTKATGQPNKPQSAGDQLGWGSNIQNARLARAAQLALQRGDHTLGLEYAQRAAQAAPNDPQLWFLLGYAARLDGKYTQSIDAYKKGLQLSPSSLDGLSGLAQSYSLAGRTAEAEKMLRQVVAADPHRKDDLYILGDISMRSANYTEALDWLGKSERMGPSAQTELLMALAYEHLGKNDEASHYLQLARGRAPNNPDVERSLAAFYRGTNDFGKAIEELRAIKNPKPDVVAELAYTYGLDGKLDDAARLYMQAADALPHDLGLQLSAAQSQVGIGSLDHANNFLERAAKIDADNYRLHAIRAEIAQMQERDGDAAREYTAAIAHLPATPIEGPLYGIQLHMNLVALYRNLGESDHEQQELHNAQTLIGALDERGSDRAEFLRLRALIKMDAGQSESALADINESLALHPRDLNGLQLDGDLLLKMGRTRDAINVYGKILAVDSRNRFALTSLGYASRAAGNDRDAEKYFTLLAKNYPSLYVPYLALGDLYTARGDYKKAQVEYARGYEIAPQNPFMVAGGMNAAIENHDLTLAGAWIQRVTAKMDSVPQVQREQERYYSFTGQTQRSADIGRKAIQAMPRDRDVAVYLGYDLLRLEQYDELLTLTTKYADVFPKEPDIPLLAGYAYKHNGQLDQAVASFTAALSRDSNVTTAYINRGFVLNDLHQPERAAADFEQAVKREPKNGEANLGLAVADLNLGRPQAAVKHTELAEAELGDSELIHLIRATAYGRQGNSAKAAGEYRAALKFDPKDGSLYLGLANIYVANRQYREALAQLQQAQQYLSDDPAIYALSARADAELHDRDAALKNVQLAEKFAKEKPTTATAADPKENPVSDVYVSTGETLNALGDQKGAMERFSEALQTPNSNRVNVRLAIAGLMAQQDRSADAERQIALAQMEVEAGDTVPPTGDQYIEAANVLQQMHEYELSQSYLARAKAAGASDVSVRVALANSYLALGQTQRAAAELAAAKQIDNSEASYQYLLAEAAVYQQEHQGTRALSAFAQAASAAGEDQTAEQDLLQAGANEGLRINNHLSLLSNLLVQPVFEDSTVYVLDAKLDSPNGPVPITDTAALPPPRSSIETDWTTAFHLHLGNIPTTGGFFQLRNARGTISVPATDSIVHRDTMDYTLNYGIDPTVHIGSNVLTFNAGVQETIRRDSLAPIEMNQNLFRAFAYVTTSSFFNAVSADGYIIHEGGAFTESPIDESALSAALNFRVGTPWGRTALVTGWGRNDQQFNSSSLGDSENYYTSSYIGLTHRFGSRLNVEGIVEDLRAWRIVPFSPLHSAISQALRPAGTIDFSLARNWDLQATTAYESTRGFHVYDMTQNGFSVGYTRPFGRTFNEETGEVHLKYPLRFAGGFRQESFINFTGQGSSQQFRPYVSVTIF